MGKRLHFLVLVKYFREMYSKIIWIFGGVFFLHFSHDEDEIRPVQQQDLHRAIEKMKKSKDAAFQNVLTHVCLDWE